MANEQSGNFNERERQTHTEQKKIARKTKFIYEHLLHVRMRECDIIPVAVAAVIIIVVVGLLSLIEIKT